MINIVMLYIFACSIIIGYLSGNIHGAYIIGKVFKDVDIREHGSGNSGTTNALRVFGLKLALPTFIIDFTKAFVPVFFASNIAQFLAFGNESFDAFESTMVITLKVMFAMGVILGHNYPFVLKFKGGKGIACTVGVLFAIEPICGLIFCMLMILIIAITRYVSLASVISAICVPIMLWYFTREIEYLVLGLMLMILAVYRHKANIVRLMNGTESKFGEKAKVK